MAAPDMDVIKEIPGYKVILKAVLKSQIQQLVEQLASSTDEESVILTASVSDGTLCHLGSDSGKVFLEDHEDIKSQFLGFCLKRHHTKRQEKERQEAQEREEALACSMQAVTPPRYGNMGPRQGFMPQRSPRYPSPRQQQGIIPVALTRGPSGPIRSPGNRHQPYPMARPQKPTLNFDQQGRAAMPGAMRLPVGNRIDGQVIKIEPDEEGDDASNQSAGDTSNAQTGSQSESRVNDSSQPSSPSAKASTPSRSQDNDDAKSDTSSSTIPNEASDLGISDTGPPGGLSLDSDLSNLISDTPGLDTSVQSEATGSESNTQGELDPNVSVKLEAMADSEMDLEITGVELGQRPMQETMGSQEWLASVQNVMQGGASGSSADLNDQQAYKCTKALEKTVTRYVCDICGKIYRDVGTLNRHKKNHTGYRPYKCHFCSKQYVRKDFLTKHMKISHKTKRAIGESSQLRKGSYKCNICGKTYLLKSSLDRHNRIHTEEGHYKCNICSKTYTLKCSLNRHYRSHTGIRPYHCEICQKEFLRKDYLDKHVSVHANFQIERNSEDSEIDNNPSQD